MSRLAPSLAVFFLLISSSPAAAQSPSSSPAPGSVSGVVVDATLGETLIGVNIRLVDVPTLVGTTTDVDGRYRIDRLAPGSYSIAFSYIGFGTKTVRDVIVTSGETTRLDVSLAEETELLDEVVVEARAMRNNEATLLRDRQKAPGISDAISAEAIGQSGGSNAADAMSMVTGASVVGGKYVLVRGLGDRYATTQLNGVAMPSADPDKKAVQFDLFPAGLLDNIVTAKTYTPDQPGNFSGGLVNISTRAYPDELDVSFSVSSTMNTATHFGADFITGPSGSMDWLGFDDGLRDIPALLQGDAVSIPSAQRARRDADLAAQLDAYSKSFNGVMSPIRGKAPLNYKYSLSVGNRRNVVNRPFGFVVGLSYSSGSSYYESGTTGRYSFSGSQLTPDLLLDDRMGSQEVTWGGIANLTYQFSPKHEIRLNSMYNRVGESTARLQVGSWPKELGPDPNSIRTNRFLSWTERDVLSSQLFGKHHLPGLLASTIEWRGSYSRTVQDEPDRRYFASTRRIIGTTEVMSVSASGFQDPSRYFRGLVEDSWSAAADATVPFRQWSGQNANLKLGGAMRTTDREFNERVFAIRPSTQVRFDGDEEAFFANHNMGVIAVDSTTGAFTFGNVIADDSKARNNYTGSEAVHAAYAMVELPVAGGFKAIAGARLESTTLSVASADSTLSEGRIDKVDILPSINLVYAVNDRMNIRAAATRTIARPTFREIAPFASFDFEAGDFRIGNPGLHRTSITNLDLRWEYFPGIGEILAASAFYKDLHDPIEEAIVGGTNGQLQFQNVGHAIVAGLELEMRSTLGVIAEPLRNFAIGVNASLVESRVDIPQTELETRRAIDPDASGTRDLQGQSPFLVNADLRFVSQESGTNVGFYFNVFGRRLANVSLGGAPDVYEQPRPVLDLTISQKLPARWTVKASAKNLLDSPFRKSHRFEGDEYIYQEYHYGRSISLGFSWTTSD